MNLATVEQPIKKSSREELEALLYRFLTLSQIENNEDRAAGRAVLSLDAFKHRDDNKAYYDERFKELRKG